MQLAVAIHLRFRPAEGKEAAYRKNAKRAVLVLIGHAHIESLIFEEGGLLQNILAGFRRALLFWNAELLLPDLAAALDVDDRCLAADFLVPLPHFHGCRDVVTPRLAEIKVRHHI